MVDVKVPSNGNVQVWAVPASGIADINAPTAAEINAGVNVTEAIAWDGTTFPTASDSEDMDDRSLLDRGNATSRGTPSFEATLNFFYPRQEDKGDTTNPYTRAYNLFRVPRVPIILVTRVLQGTTGVVGTAAAGQWVSLYKFISDGWEDDVAEDDSYKYAVGFLTQGALAVYTQVKNAGAPVLTRVGTGNVAVGAKAVIRATLGGKDATQTVQWSSSAPNIATVSPNGVVKGVATGTANITASHPAATGAATAIPITVGT